MWLAVFSSPRLQLPLLHLAPWAIALLLPQIGNRVYVIAAQRLIGLFAAGLEGFAGWLRRVEGIAAAADEISAAGFLQRLADFKIVLGLEKLQKGTLELAVAQGVGDVNGFLGKWIDAG